MSLKNWADNGWLLPYRTNTAEYDSVGRVSPEEATELISFATELPHAVKNWLQVNHPELI